MISNLQYLGIYEGAIDRAIDIAERAVEEYVTSSSHPVDDLASDAYDWLQSCGSFEDITNSIISAWFTTACAMIGRDNSDLDIDWFVNCDDSNIIINGDFV